MRISVTSSSLSALRSVTQRVGTFSASQARASAAKAVISSGVIAFSIDMPNVCLIHGSYGSQQPPSIAPLGPAQAWTRACASAAVGSQDLRHLLGVESGAQVGLERAIEQLLRQPKRGRAGRGKAPGQLGQALLQLGGGPEPAHEPEVGCLLSGDRSPGQQDVLGAMQADLAQ